MKVTIGTKWVPQLTLSLSLALVISILGFPSSVTIGSTQNETIAANESAGIPQNRISVKKLSNGKFRIVLHLAPAHSGKQVSIRTARYVDGKRSAVLLGKSKLSKTGRGVISVRRAVLPGDFIIVRQGGEKLLGAKVIEVIGTEVNTLPPPDVAGGNFGGSGTPAKIFTVRKDGGILSFGGNATGTVSFTLSPSGEATFSRGGVSASARVPVSGGISLSDESMVDPLKLTTNAMVEAAYVADVVDFLSLPQFSSDGKAVSISGPATIAQAQTLRTLDTYGSYNIEDAVPNIFEGSFPSRSIKASAGEVIDDATTVKVTGALALHEWELLDDRTFDINTLTFALRDTWASISNEINTDEIGWAQSYEISDIDAFTKSGMDVREVEVMRRASNYITDSHTYSISDSASAIAAATSEVRNSATNLSATGNATIAQAAIISGASNSGTTTYSVEDVVANIFEGSFPFRWLKANVGDVLDASSYVTVTDAITLYEWDVLDEQIFDILNLTFTLRDTWARISNEINTDEIGWAQSYEISDIDTFSKNGLSEREIDVLRGAANFNEDLHTYTPE